MRKLVAIFPSGLMAPLLFTLFLTTALAAGPYEDRSTADYQYAKGTVQSVSLEEQTVTIQPHEGPKITVRINPETEFHWIKRLEDLKARQQVKIWYRPETGGNIGLKIQKLPDLGC